MNNTHIIESLGYVRIGMRDPGQWAEFGESILGFQSHTRGDGTVHLRMDSAPVRFIVEPAERDGFIAAGWECASERFDRLVAGFKERSVALTAGSPEACASRSVDAFVSGLDPSGNRFEVFRGRGPAEAAFQSPIDGVAFVADEVGLGHAIFPANDIDATTNFYIESMEFGISDELTLPPPAEGAPEMKVNFLHAKSPRHHSLGFFNGPAPSGVVHIMVEMTTLDAVGACLDRVNAAGHPLTATLGRHFNDGMVSFYFLAPGGIPIEVGFDGLQFDWDDFTPTKSTVGDIWGHEYQFPGS